MTFPPPRRRLRLPAPRWGWPFVVIGWICVVLAPVIFFNTGVPTPLIAAVSIVPVALGSFLLAHRGGGKAMVLLPLLFLSFFALVAGMDASSDWFVYHAAGETAMCQVTGVRKEVSTIRMPPDHGRTRTSHDVNYLHTTVCPHATYTIDRDQPYPVGTRAEVTYDPRGRAQPVFSDDIPGMHTIGVVLLSVGAATILLIPFIAWALGRRRPPAMSPAALSGGTPAYRAPLPPYEAPPPSAYVGRRPPPEPDPRLQAMADEIMTARGVSRILKIVKLGTIIRRRPPWPPRPPMGPPPVS